MQSIFKKYQPDEGLTHDLINKLSIIIGNCDLLQEETAEGSHDLKRLKIIHDAATSMAQELKEHERQFFI